MKKTLKNPISAVLSSITSILVSFFAQKVFLSILNTEYLGINGLFSNIISMLAIFELGISSAIIFNLYKPLAKNDRTKIKALMYFYKKAYAIISFIVAIVGISIIPFLPLIIKEVSIDININIVYILFLIDTVCSYLLTYRRSILYADQKNYIISYVHIGYTVMMNASQLLLLALSKNYYAYLGLKIIMRIIENIIIHIIVKKQYPYLNRLGKERISKKVEKDIFKKIRALLFHKIGTFIVLGSDNIIISKFIGLIEVGLYSNYYLISNAIQQLVGQAVTALTPSIGHDLAIKKSERTYSAFQKIRFICFCLSCISATVFMTCMQPLISVWLGEQYLLDILTLSMLSLNLFQRLQRYSFSTFKEAAGIYYEDRFIPIIESLMNIIFSIILLRYFGLAGVFMGTTISGLALWCYSYPKYVYKKLFKRSYGQYARETIGYILVFIICVIVAFTATSVVIFNDAITQLVFNAIISIIISIVIILITMHRTMPFRYFINYVPITKKVIKK